MRLLAACCRVGLHFLRYSYAADWWACSCGRQYLASEDVR